MTALTFLHPTVEHGLVLLTALLSGSLLFLSTWAVARYYKRGRQHPTRPGEPPLPLSTWLFLASYWLLVIALVVRVTLVSTAFAWIFLPALFAGIVSLFMILNFKGDQPYGLAGEELPDDHHDPAPGGGDR